MLNRLKYERLKKGYTQIALAQLAGMNPGDVGRLERGECILWPKWAQALSKVLGIPAEELLVEVEIEDRGARVHRVEED